MLNTITYTPVVERSAFTTGQAYDDLHRLLTSSITGAANGDNVGRTYTYSAIGNILSASDQGTYLYESTNYANPHAVTKVGSAVYGYDNNGNLTNDSVWAHQWDYQNKLTQSQKTGSTVTYQYDHSGQRTKYANGTKTIRYANKLYNTDGTTATKHIYAGNQLIGTVEGSTLQYVHTDHLTGSNVATNNAGTMIQLLDYQPYGALRIDWKSGTYDEQRKFTGHEFDRDTALTYGNARYYNQGIGRWISQDAVFLATGDEKIIKEKTGLTLSGYLKRPQFNNAYAYAGNNPLTHTDVTGDYTGVDDAAFALGGAAMGVTALALTDAIRGNASSWQTYVGAASGGAVAGLATLYFPAVGVFGGAVIGAGSAGFGNLSGQTLSNLSGDSNTFNVGDLYSSLFSGMVGGGFGAKLPAPVPGVTQGRNSSAAITSQLVTKLRGGTIQNISLGSAARMFVFSSASQLTETVTEGVLGGLEGIKQVFQSSQQQGSQILEDKRMYSNTNSTPSAILR